MLRSCGTNLDFERELGSSPKLSDLRETRI